MKIAIGGWASRLLTGLAVLVAALGCGSNEVEVENDQTGLPPEAVQQLNQMSQMKQKMEQEAMQKMQGQTVPPTGEAAAPPAP